jgi:hypothetical protein
MPIIGIDHVMLAAGDLDAARGEFRTSLDRPSRPGSRHPGWGTANAVVRFADTYLELITVLDRDVALSRPAGRRMVDVIDAGGGWVAPVLAATDLDDTCRTLRGQGVEVAEPIDGESVRPDGRRRRWRIGAHGDEFRTGRLPSMIEYLDPWPEDDPDPAELTRNGIQGLAGVEIAVPDLRTRTEEYAALLGAAPERTGRTAAWTLPDGRGLRLVAPGRRGDPVDVHLDRFGPGLFQVDVATEAPESDLDTRFIAGARLRLVGPIHPTVHASGGTRS